MTGRRCRYCGQPLPWPYPCLPWPPDPGPRPFHRYLDVGEAIARARRVLGVAG